MQANLGVVISKHMNSQLNVNIDCYPLYATFYFSIFTEMGSGKGMILFN